MCNAPSFIDVFAGAGGISLGLYNSGWKGLFAIEKSKMAFETFKFNLLVKKNAFDWPKWFPVSEHDINDVLTTHQTELHNLRGSIDLVAGGPPCQGFSMAGRRSRNDDRNKLVLSYIEFIKQVRPSMIFLENVTGFKSGFKNNERRERAYSEYVSEKLSIMGYDVAHRVINFSEFGVPQRRKRFILVGFQKKKAEAFFNRLYKQKNSFLSSKKLKKSPNVGEAISDLEQKHGSLKPLTERFSYGVYGLEKSNYQKYFRRSWDKGYPDSHRFANHRISTIERSKYILENCTRNTDIGRDVKRLFNLKKQCLIPLDKNENSPTLTTLPDDLIHYSEPRILTVREYSRLQTFPDWYEIKSKYTTGGKHRRVEVPRYSQLGNAVPPLFTELSGRVLKEMR